jgi:hypothetical protein
VEFDGDLFDISPTTAIEGPSEDFIAGGFGDDEYGDDEYGDARGPQPDRKRSGPAFTVYNWGEDILVMVSSDGRLLRWSPPDPGDDPAVAAPVPDAPSGHSFVVTPERHVMIFQYGGNSAGFAWCDEEDVEEWDFASITNKAGNYLVEPASPIIASISVGDNGVLFFTSRKAHVSRWVGLPAVYSRGVDISDGVTPVSPQSITNTGSGEAIWTSDSGFYKYDGVSVSPIPCSIWAWVKKNCDFNAARFSAFTIHMSTKSEVWWHFPSTSTGGNDRVVIYNYKEGWWSMGRMARTAGFGADFNANPIMANGVMVYRHNVGDRYADTTERPWAESFNVTVQDGARLSMVRQIEPAVDGDYTVLRYSLAYQTIRTPSNEKYSPERRIQPNGLVDLMVAAKDFRLRVSHVGNVITNWTLGPIGVDYSIKGKHT